MLLEGKVAVVYGGGGKIGGTAARAFARDGARVFLAGRTLEKLQRVADEIAAAGGKAEVAQVDALDKESIEGHLDSVVGKAGGIDISFNAVWIRGDLQGKQLIDMPLDYFTTPVMSAITTHFLTATAAARHMVKQGSNQPRFVGDGRRHLVDEPAAEKRDDAAADERHLQQFRREEEHGRARPGELARKGVILTLSSSAAGLTARDYSMHRPAGFATACASIEALSRSLAGELGPHGIRVVCLRSDAIPETWPELPPEAARVKAYMEEGSALRRMPTLAEVANAAVFMASDRASAMTGTIVNLTCGSVMDGT